MATDDPTATSEYLNKPSRSLEEVLIARHRAEIADIEIHIDNAIADLDQLEATLIFLTNGQYDEHLIGLFNLLADTLGNYLSELRTAHGRLQASAGRQAD